MKETYCSIPYIIITVVRILDDTTLKRKFGLLGHSSSSSRPRFPRILGAARLAVPELVSKSIPLECSVPLILGGSGALEGPTDLGRMLKAAPVLSRQSTHTTSCVEQWGLFEPEELASGVFSPPGLGETRSESRYFASRR